MYPDRMYRPPPGHLERFTTADGHAIGIFKPNRDPNPNPNPDQPQPQPYGSIPSPNPTTDPTLTLTRYTTVSEVSSAPLLPAQQPPQQQPARVTE